MKKLLLLLFIFIFTIPVNADEVDYKKDKLTIESLNTNIVLLDDNTYRVTENYSTKLIFGDLPDTFFFQKNVPLSYDYSYNRKNYTYKVTPTILKVISDTYFNTYNEKNNLLIKVGDQYQLYSEKKDIEISYDVKLDKKETAFSYPISNNLYDVNKTTFSVIFPHELVGKSIKFSLDGKNFSDTIEGLTYNMENKFMLSGTYNNVLSANKSLILRVGDPKDDVMLNNELLIYISLSVLVIVIIAFVIHMFRRKKK